MKTARIAAATLGVIALLYGLVLAALHGQTVYLLAAGILLIVLAWIGGNWEEIAAKFGDAEVRIKRIQNNAREAIGVVEQVAKALPGDREAVTRAAQLARTWVNATVAEERNGSEAGLEAFEAVYGRLDFPENDGSVIHVTDWDVTRGDVTVLVEASTGEVTPAIYSLSEFHSPHSSLLSVQQVEGSTTITLEGMPAYDWTVDKDLMLVTPEGRFHKAAKDGTYKFPEDWGLSGKPAWAHVLVVIDSIYGGEKAVLGSATVIAQEGRSTVGARRSAARSLRETLRGRG